MWELPPLLEGLQKPSLPGYVLGLPVGWHDFWKNNKHVAATTEEAPSCWLRPAKDDVSLPMSNGRSQESRKPHPCLDNEAGVSREFLPAAWKT